MNELEYVKFDEVLEKIINAYVEVIDLNPYYKTIDVSEYENDKFISFTSITRQIEFDQEVLRDFFNLVRGRTPNYVKPLTVSFLPYHLPREVIEEIVEKSENMHLLRLKGFNVHAIRLFKRNFQVCGIVINKKTPLKA